MNGLLIGFLALITLLNNASYANCDKTLYEIAEDSFEKATGILSPSELVGSKNVSCFQEISPNTRLMGLTVGKQVDCNKQEITVFNSYFNDKNRRPTLESSMRTSEANADILFALPDNLTVDLNKAEYSLCYSWDEKNCTKSTARKDSATGKLVLKYKDNKHVTFCLEE